jgi:Uncharacterized conserved protein
MGTKRRTALKHMPIFLKRAQWKQTSCVWSESTFIANLTAPSALHLHTVIPKKDMFRNELLNLHSNNFRRVRICHALRCAAKLDRLPTTVAELFSAFKCKKTVLFA